MEKNALCMLFEKMEEDEMFKFKDEELQDWEQEFRDKSDKLTLFIGTRIHPKARKKLIYLLNEYKEAKSEYCAIQNRLYFESGIKIGANLNNSLGKN